MEQKRLADRGTAAREEQFFQTLSSCDSANDCGGEKGKAEKSGKDRSHNGEKDFLRAAVIRFGQYLFFDRSFYEDRAVFKPRLCDEGISAVVTSAVDPDREDAVTPVDGQGDIAVLYMQTVCCDLQMLNESINGVNLLTTRESEDFHRCQQYASPHSR